MCLLPGGAICIEMTYRSWSLKYFSHTCKKYVSVLSITVNMPVFSQASAVGLSPQPVRSDVEGCAVDPCPMSVDYNHSQGVWPCYSLVVLLFSLKQQF